MTRAERLQARFNIIQQSLEYVYGRELAFAAASVAWLRAVQYGAKQSMCRMRDWHPEVPQQYCTERAMLLEELDAEIELMLKGFHSEICAHLGVDPGRAIEVSKSFEQVVQDICLQGG